jgi:hypothetical protein
MHAVESFPEAENFSSGYMDNKLELHKEILRPAGEDAKTQAFHANFAMCFHLPKVPRGQQGLKERTIGAQ